MGFRVVIAAIKYEGNILIGKKNSAAPHSFAGMWHIPGGKVEAGESDSEALKREMREETCLDIRVGQHFGCHRTPSRKKALWYECFADSDAACSTEELEDVLWVPRTKVIEYCDPLVVSYWSQPVRDYFS